MSPFSIEMQRSSFNDYAMAYNLLWLFGDFAKQISFDISVTVSLYDTIGSLFLISIFGIKNSHKSCRQISICSSPLPEIICSPDSSELICTKGSEFPSFLSPSSNFGRSAGFFGATATLTTGETLYLNKIRFWLANY